MIGRLHREQPRLRGRIARETVIPVEMVGGDVEQDRDIAIEALRQIDLIARQFEYVDAAFGQGLLFEDRQPDIAAEQAGDARRLQDMVARKSVVEGKGVSVTV